MSVGGEVYGNFHVRVSPFDLRFHYLEEQDMKRKKYNDFMVKTYHCEEMAFFVVLYIISC